jgi:hypothetical protein
VVLRFSGATSIRRINTQLATLTERLVLGNDSWSQALSLNNVISSNPNVQFNLVERICGTCRRPERPSR